MLLRLNQTAYQLQTEQGGKKGCHRLLPCLESFQVDTGLLLWGFFFFP